MTRYAIDAPVALRLVREGRTPAAEHALVAPAVLRSHALAVLYTQVREGTIDDKTGRRFLDGIATMKVRLLGDRVSRATAWRMASELAWIDPAPAEYLAVAALQADALVSDDPVLLDGASRLNLPVAGYDALFTER